VLISVPHGGLEVPEELAALCILTPEQIAKDGDEGAAEIYDFPAEVVAFVKAEIARAILDLNRAPDDFRRDGVVKTHTCFEEPVYSEALARERVDVLLTRHYHPYHERLRELASRARLGVDCHTMLAVGPPIGPGAGERRPRICLSNADGACPQEWLESLGEHLHVEFGEVALNEPFKGGYIVREHARELPWVQLEMSREPFAGNDEKRARVLSAITAWCKARLA
jgi:formiminoglutamase